VSASESTITFLGQSTVRIVTPGGKQVLIDSWVMSNPYCPELLKEVADLDLVLITRAHRDHFDDAVEVFRRSGATGVASNEVCVWLETLGIEKLEPMCEGGSQRLMGLTITATHADHSNSIATDAGKIYGGKAFGCVLTLENGFRIYHAGDTALFGDMKLINELYHPDLAILPIGDRFTMGPREAAYAIRLLGVANVIPVHYGTFPIFTGTPDALRRETDDIAGLEIIELQPGETYRL